MASKNESTLLAYKKDITVFTGWLKEVKSAKGLPNETVIIEYMEALKGGYPNNKEKRVPTLRRKLCAIAALYKAKNKELDKKAIISELNNKERFPTT